MEQRPDSPVVRLGHADFPTDDPRGDLRGRHVVTLEDETVGLVEDLFIDVRDRTVRLLEVGLGGSPGSGVHTTLVPIEVVEGVDENHVDLGHTRDRVAAAPIYNPHVVPTRPYLDEVYDHYGCVPPWAPGTDAR